jgi:hypothetical protein
MALVTNLWQATTHGKQRRTPPRKEKAKKESSSHNGSEFARFALGSTAAPLDAETLGGPSFFRVFRFFQLRLLLLAVSIVRSIKSSNDGAISDTTFRRLLQRISSWSLIRS